MRTCLGVELFSNILIDSHGRVKVADFGLATFTDLATRITRENQVPGTAAYLSPELVQGGRPSIASDVYGLGCVLHECLTGKPALEGSPMDILNRLGRDSVPLLIHDSFIPQPLAVIRNCAMRVEPENRYSSAAEFADDLRRWLRGEAILAQPETWFQRFTRTIRRRRKQMAVFGGIAVLTLATSTWATYASWLNQIEKERVREASVEIAQRTEESEQQRALALQHLHDSVFQTQDMLRNRAGTLELRKELLSKAIAGMEQVVSIQGAPKLDHDTAVALLRLGQIQLALGEAADGRKTLDRAREIFQQVPFNAEEDVISCRSLAAIIDSQGDAAFAQRNFSETQTHFEQALELRKIALEIDPENPEAIVQFCSNLIRLSDVSRNLGKPVEEKDYVQAAFDRINDAHDRFPDNAKVKRGSSIVLSRRLVLAMAQQDAITSRELASQFRERVAEMLLLEPLNLEYQNDYALALAQSARVCNMDDDFDNATRFADEASQAFRKIALAEPESALAQSRLAISIHNEAQAWLSSGNLEVAEQRWVEAAKIQDRLFEENPTNTRYALLGGESWMWQGFTDLSRGRVASGLQKLERAYTTLKAGAAGANQQPQVDGPVETVRRITDQYTLAASLMSAEPAARFAADPTVSMMCGYLLSHSGRMSEALALAEHWREFESNDMDAFVSVHSQRAAIYTTAMVESSSTERQYFRDSAINSLEIILVANPAWKPLMRASHDFVDLRNEPEYQAILQSNSGK